MTSPAYGEMAELLPDGSRLIKRTVLSAAQLDDLVHDGNLLARMRASRAGARALNIGLRVVIVVAGLGLAALVIAEAIPLLLAAAIAVGLLIAAEVFWRLDNSLAKAQVADLEGLRGLDAFIEHTGALASDLARMGRIGMYEAVLLDGPVLAVGHSLVGLIKDADGSGSLTTAVKR